MTTPFLSAMLAVLRKDLLAELRSRELISAMALFSTLSILVFSFALQLDQTVRRESVSGVLWVTVIFAVILGLNRDSAVERESDSFSAMLLAPVSRGAIYTGKLLGNFLFASIVGIALLVVMTVLYNVPMLQLWVVLVLVLGTFGLSSVGTLLSTMTVQTRTRETLLPIVMLPVALPLLLATVSATLGIIEGNETDTFVGWIQIVAVLDVIYLTLCVLLFDYVVED